MIADISYKNYKKSSDIHGTVLYPAVMVAPMQKDILRELIDVNRVTSIFDPFHGSGTALYESAEISTNIRLFGCDINPLANLITKVKLQGVSKDIDSDIIKLKEHISVRDYKKHTFTNINKWFREDIIIDLSKIRQAIISIDNKQNRLYFWCILSDIVRKYSNTRSSTYKLHIKPEYLIGKLENNVIKDFISSVENNLSKFKNSFSSFSLFKCDTLLKIKEFADDFFDISITSPPYGDNATTVPYGQFSMLSLYWIDENDLELEGWELDNYSKIDSNSLGGRKNIDITLSNFEAELLEPYLSKISYSKKAKVISFFCDYFVFLKELCRVSNKHIIMTLGNRTVDGVTIDLTSITRLYLESNNFTNKQLLIRQIPNKRIPYRVSKVNKKPVKSITHEYVIIHEKL